MIIPALLFTLGFAAAALVNQRASPPDSLRWKRQAQAVTIRRDDWGIPHVHGKTDADAVFGLIYAQAEDDFNRIEVNYLNAMGRLAEAEGESELYRDLRMKLFIDPDSMREKYAASPEWLKRLMNAWADGLNYYLSTHPQVRPRVIRRFEPWMALSFTEGSIGGDIESISLDGLEGFYGQGPIKKVSERSGLTEEPAGSNGFAIAPSRTATGHALLLINPHTSFYFRAEVQVTSDEGLNVYGAVTWGQLFVYQGFNQHAGWIHSSTGADAIDEYAETVVHKRGGMYYRYGSQVRPLRISRITVPYKTESGMARREFTVYRSHHGPIVREADGKWIAVRLMEEPVNALMQSYLRTKATGYASFKKTMELHTNSSNNTVFADADGNIAYFHANFMPRRDTSFDWTRPVDGSNPATEWKGLYSVDQSPLVLNPPNGWIQNTNDWPYSAAGPNSPKKDDYPPYMDRAGENFRGIHAQRVLANQSGFTLESLIAAAFDTYLTAFDTLLPPLFEAYDQTPAADSLKAKLREQVATLRSWDRRWSVGSTPTSLAVYWGDQLARLVPANSDSGQMWPYLYMATKTTPEQRLEALARASAKLTADFGSWKVPWGEINRFQRLTDDIDSEFSDSAPSIPVPFTSSRWGSLAAFGARSYSGSKRIYGSFGNSFVAVVEFGTRVRARAVTAGGESGDPKSPHFNDQAERYATGNLREVYFYPEDVKGHVEREYHPGQ
jgi:acyl-homoserine-lactone acylase